MKNYKISDRKSSNKKHSLKLSEIKDSELSNKVSIENITDVGEIFDVSERLNDRSVSSFASGKSRENKDDDFLNRIKSLTAMAKQKVAESKNSFNENLNSENNAFITNIGSIRSNESKKEINPVKMTTDNNLKKMVSNDDIEDNLKNMYLRNVK